MISINGTMFAASRTTCTFCNLSQVKSKMADRKVPKREKPLTSLAGTVDNTADWSLQKLAGQSRETRELFSSSRDILRRAFWVFLGRFKTIVHCLGLDIYEVN